MIKGVIKIRKYNNRKLYATGQKGRYVRLHEIAEFVSEGYLVRVSDIRGNDITALIFAEAIFEAEKKEARFDVRLLENVLRNKMA